VVAFLDGRRLECLAKVWKMRGRRKEGGGRRRKEGGGEEVRGGERQQDLWLLCWVAGSRSVLAKVCKRERREKGGKKREEEEER
jgi:hypothetical protein